MTIISGDAFYANQFWVATRFLESLTLLAGFLFIKSKKRLNPDLLFLIYFAVSFLIGLSILQWNIFPACFIKGVGQTDFKIYSEYLIIAILIIAGILLHRQKHAFEKPVFNLLRLSLLATIISEFCFTLYISNYGHINEVGHYAKLISFYLIYKANVETGFLRPTSLIFKNLKDSEEQYRTLTENLPELIIRLDNNFNYIYINSAFEKIISSGQFSFIHKGFNADNTDSYLPVQLLEGLKKAKTDKTAQQVNFNLTNNGIDYYFYAQIVPEYNTVPETFLMIWFDVTSIRNAERDLKELNATKDKLFSIIAHDLRNPFTSLLSYSEILQRNAATYTPAQVKQFAVKVNDTAKRTYMLLENLLDWARVQTGALSPTKEILSVNELISAAKSLYEPVATTKGIQIIISSPDNLEICADRHMINTVIRNLISNAIKFTYSKGEITISTRRRAQDVLFSISDTGTGIAKEELDQLLKENSQTSKPGTSNEKGTGLGLLLCKEFIHLSDGTIWAESEYGMGTTFYFTVPGHFETTQA